MSINTIDNIFGIGDVSFLHSFQENTICTWIFGAN